MSRPRTRNKAAKERAQPVRYNTELADQICELLAEGETLRAICRREGMPTEAAVRKWALEPDHPFGAQYARAREIGYHKMADELLIIADDGTNDYVERETAEGGKKLALDNEHVQRSRLRVEARKWLLSKALPKVYGDKLEIDNRNSTHESFLDRLAAMDSDQQALKDGAAKNKAIRDAVEALRAQGIEL